MPISSVERILRFEQTLAANDGSDSALAGAIPGAILLGVALSADTENETGNVGEKFAAVGAKMLAVVGGAVVMAIGANVGGGRAKRTMARRRATVYRGPVERYIGPVTGADE